MQDFSTRRAFLQRSIALLAVAPTIPSFLDATAVALGNPADLPLTQGASGADGKILVVVQMSGGNDALSMVAPYGDDAYQAARGPLAKSGKDVLKVNDYLGLNQNFKSIKGLYDDGCASVIQGVGYPNPNRSHFRSMDIWQSGDPNDERLTSGWLGRYFDNQCGGADPKAAAGGKGKNDAPPVVPGVAIGDQAPLAMLGETARPISFESPDAYRYRGDAPTAYDRLTTIGLSHAGHDDHDDQDDGHHDEPKGRVIRASDPTVTMQSQLDYLTRTAMDARVSSEQLLASVKGHHPPKEYPRNQFGDGLKTVAAMIRGGLPSRVYYVELGGFDTHANQQGRHDNLMKQLDEGVGAFWADMRDQKNADRVLMVTFSEFGRRVKANASGGTDHGAAAAMMLLGPAVTPGLLGDHPSLTDLDDGDLKYGVDFRNVYSGILEKWLETPSAPILGHAFRPMNVVRG